MNVYCVSIFSRLACTASLITPHRSIEGHQKSLFIRCSKLACCSMLSKGMLTLNSAPIHLCRSRSLRSSVPGSMSAGSMRQPVRPSRHFKLLHRWRRRWSTQRVAASGHFRSLWLCNKNKFWKPHRKDTCKSLALLGYDKPPVARGPGSNGPTRESKQFLRNEA